jgi:hypothetical protein
MKRLFALVAAVALFTGTAGMVSAAPFKAHDKNPNVVAHYDPGLHAIIGIDGSSTVVHMTGRDIVMKAGNSCNFQQWFENDEIGYHSVWKHVGHDYDGNVPHGWVLVENARNPETGDTWGHHLCEGDYLVKTNAYMVGGHN